MTDDRLDPGLSRRRFLAQAAGVATPALLFPGALRAEMRASGAQDLTAEMILHAAKVAGLELTREEAEGMVEDVANHFERYREIDEYPLDNGVPLPFHFDPRVPGVEVERPDGRFRWSEPAVERPSRLEDVAFWSVPRLAGLIQTRQVTSLELTEMYLERLRRFNPVLNCVVNLTPELAREEARRADAELAEGRYRGVLHGIPYGVKDIIAVRGYPTTWGAAPWKDRVIDTDATVIRRLRDAGAVLVAKLATGELAFGDQWFGGRTNNPWAPEEEGSSGSSAGPASATAAGLVGFAIGTDTGGSISSPSERCGVVGLRPTFGRVSRYGVMAAGTTLDKLGPMCRSPEGCAVVLHAIAGPDGQDLAVPDDMPVSWDAELDPRSLRIGYFRTGFDAEEDAEYRSHHERVLETLRSLGWNLTALELPTSALNFWVEYVERAAAFDEVVRSDLEDQIRRMRIGPEMRGVFHLVSGVEYLQANRVRMLLMEEFARATEDVDVVLSPRTTFQPQGLSLNPVTSFTGHPVVVVPGTLARDGTPMGVMFVGKIYREGDLLAVARRYFEETGFGDRHPPRFI
ncbi:MAG: amidase [Gemmatimonadota bacterium]